MNDKERHVPKQYCLQLSQDRSYPYTVVRSTRAKYIRIKLSNAGQLSLVIPQKISIKRGQEFIQARIVWIEKHLKKINPSLNTGDVLPNTLDLKLLGEQWKIVYLSNDEQYLSLREESSKCLEVRGDVTNKLSVKKLLNKWCQHKSRNIFLRMLDDIAIEYGFHYNRLSIRSQKTRWGSCSQNKNISLNSKLLFFQENIVRSVMIHELCHTIEMNHSRQFWNLVEQCDPDYMLNQDLLKSSAKKISL